MNKTKPNYKGKRTKGGKPFRKPEGKPDSTVAEQKYNDASWYVKDGQLAKDVASLSFNNALGSPVRIEQELSGISGTKSPLIEVEPGIMSIMTVPAMGYSGDGSSPINIAAKNIYSYVRHQNSGHSNYDAPDLMMYLGAMDSIYSFIATLMRIYGTARTFSQVNRYVGDALLTAQGVNPTEIRANLANFRSYINMYITKASAFCTPNIMTLYRRHFWMYSGIYKDQDILKSQMYLYRPVALWQYAETDGAGKLESRPFLANFSESNGLNHANWTLSELYTFGNNLLAAVVNSEDINIMSGDILKAYGQGNLWSLGLISEDYVVLPVYSDEVLDQIHNTTFCGNKPTTGVNSTTTTDPVATMTGLDVTQNVDPTQDGRIVFQPEFINVSTPCWTRIVDLHYDDPTPEQVLVATRNSVMGAVYGQETKYTCEILTCGSDLALYASVMVLSVSGGGSASIAYFKEDGVNVGYFASSYVKFERAPLCFAISGPGTSGIPANITNVLGDIENYTLVSYDDLRRMHESAILAQLGVPFYGVHTQG